jgi:hypothetical protein
MKIKNNFKNIKGEALAKLAALAAYLTQARLGRLSSKRRPAISGIKSRPRLPNGRHATDLLAEAGGCLIDFPLILL